MIIKQVLADLKAQPVIAWVTILGTALAMFLIMVVVMLNQVKVVDMAPESNRSRMLFVTALRAESEDGISSASLAMPVVEQVIKPITSAEGTAVYERWGDEQIVSTNGVAGFSADTKETDNGFFQVFDFTFKAGAPYDSADVASHLRKAVIAESVARKLFNSVENAVGREFEIDEETYSVSGVVADVSPATDKAYAQVWKVIPEQEIDEDAQKFGTGSYAVAILAHKGQKLDDIKAEVVSYLAKLNAAKANEGVKLDFNEGPYTQEESATQTWSNVPPDVPKERRNRLIVYAILLIIPAINLSSMTRSRLAWRVGEIGVRRAYGATRGNIILSVLGENLIITLAGGALGLIFSFIFGTMLFDAVYSAGTFTTFNTAVTIGAEAMFDWSTFAYALLFCLILNILSTGLPAFRASRLNPVDALAARTK